jgi:Zn-dependent peptidase ImmA (M78 family)
MVDETLRSVAEGFWARVGAPEPYPRCLEASVLWALPVAILKVRDLSVDSVEAWLRRRGVPFGLGCHDRNLRACLVSYGGRGLIFLDATDPEDELRFSLAHEISHFLLDYLLPRRRAIARFGSGVTEVLDGRRQPLVSERIDAVLADVPIGVHTHLMDRTAAGIIGRTAVLDVESRADRLALELLAPEDEVRRRVADLGGSETFQQAVTNVVNVLVDAFKLPPQIAEGYGRSLCRSWYGGPSFREWLGV